MKRTFFGKTIFGFLMVFFAIIVASCPMDGRGDFSPSRYLSTEEKDEIVATFRHIGLEHNVLLTAFYNAVGQIAPRSLTETDVFYQFFGCLDNAIIFKLPVTGRIARSQNNPDTLVSVMIDNDLVCDPSARYMFLIEELLDNPLDDFDEMIAAITVIQHQSLNTLTGIELDKFMAFAETAKSSLLFWTVNIEALDNMEFANVINPDTTFANARIFSNVRRWWRENVARIAMSAASDAAGAAAGAGIGAAIGSSVPAVGTAVGASIGAVIAGAASSEAGWRTGRLSIVIPLTQIENDIRSR
ncbi:MAG: hypothetical protein FWC64_02445 [Treponema sp.]|nr:hypothetical protein [Treponema sp.]